MTVLKLYYFLIYREMTSLRSQAYLSPHQFCITAGSTDVECGSWVSIDDPKLGGKSPIVLIGRNIRVTQTRQSPKSYIWCQGPAYHYRM